MQSDCRDDGSQVPESGSKRVLRIIKILRILKIIRLLKGIKLVECALVPSALLPRFLLLSAGMTSDYLPCSTNSFKIISATVEIIHSLGLKLFRVWQDRWGLCCGLLRLVHIQDHEASCHRRFQRTLLRLPLLQSDWGRYRQSSPFAPKIQSV